MDTSNFTITKQAEAPDVKFEAAGYIIYDTAGQFEKALSDTFEDAPESLTVDMGKVVLFTSVGIRVVLKVYKNATERGISFFIVNPSDVVKNVLDLSNLTNLLLK